MLFFIATGRSPISTSAWVRSWHEKDDFDEEGRESQMFSHDMCESCNYSPKLGREFPKGSLLIVSTVPLFFLKKKISNNHLNKDGINKFTYWSIVPSSSKSSLSRALYCEFRVSVACKASYQVEAKEFRTGNTYNGGNDLRYRCLARVHQLVANTDTIHEGPISVNSLSKTWESAYLRCNAG